MSVIEADNLVKRYGDGHLALNDLSMKLNKKVTVVLGRNGAGKTTLLRILSTQLAHTSGTVTVLGYDIDKETDRIREKIVSIPQEAEEIEFLTPEEHLEIYLSARGITAVESEKRTRDVLRKLGLYEAKGRMAYQLSGGMKRKIFVAMALAADAKLTFLDEPTVGLDPVSRMEVWSAIKKINGSVVLTTHYMEEAKLLADEIVLIDNGRVSMQGTVKELLKPLSGIMRVDGVGEGRLQYDIAGLKISYLASSRALMYAKKGFEIRQPDLEDLFIIKAAK